MEYAKPQAEHERLMHELGVTLEIVAIVVARGACVQRVVLEITRSGPAAVALPQR
jgi:hypothetical protein